MPVTDSHMLWAYFNTQADKKDVKEKLLALVGKYTNNYKSSSWIRLWCRAAHVGRQTTSAQSAQLANTRNNSVLSSQCTATSKAQSTMSCTGAFRMMTGRSCWRCRNELQVPATISQVTTTVTSVTLGILATHTALPAGIE